jgi:hypothetical protein
MEAVSGKPITGRRVPEAGRRFFLSRGHAVWLHIGTNEFYDLVHGRTGLENRAHTRPLQAIHILVGDDAAHEHQHVIYLVLLEEVHNARHYGIVRPGKNRQPDHVHIFLQRRVHNHFGSLAQTGVDDFHAGIAQSARNHLGAAIVTIKAGLGDQHADFLLSHLVI